MRTIGERIRDERKRAGLTQKQLGEKLGLSAQSIAQWENDLRKPKSGTLKKIAYALDTNIWNLYGDLAPDDFMNGYISGLDDEQYLHGRDHYSFSETELELIDFFSKLNEEGQQKAVERVGELAEIPKYQK